MRRANAFLTGPFDDVAVRVHFGRTRHGSVRRDHDNLQIMFIVRIQSNDSTTKLKLLNLSISIDLAKPGLPSNNQASK